jgi:hypothetical protein
MDSRVYYGEYSLKHWIKMMLSRNIILPEYQRSFVWEEKDVRRLVDSIHHGQFVQPVTIALYKVDEGMPGQNLIIDGQQRLSSILLAYLGYMPDKNKFEKPEILASDEDDAADEALDETTRRGPIKWRFGELFEDGGDNNEGAIRKRMEKDSRYFPLDLNLPEGFFDKTFLGYSYIVPSTADAHVIQRGFSQLFRDINYFGKKLSALESRRSLYYLNADLLPYLEGQTTDKKDVLCNMRLVDKMQPIKIDFVRYLSIISQYTITENPDKVLVGYSASSTRESFYADYVSYLLGLEQEDREWKFDGFSFADTFPQQCWKERYERLRESVERLRPMFKIAEKKTDAFASWIDADYWFFGLIYAIVFAGKTLKDDLTGLDKVINEEIAEKKDWDYYAKTPNRLGNLRDRLGRSIDIIWEYVQ